MNRWRFLARILIFAAVAGGWGWYSIAPRIDRRLLGEWAVASYDGNPNFDEWPFPRPFVLLASGDIDSPSIREAGAVHPVLVSYPMIPFGYRAGFHMSTALWSVQNGRLVVVCRYERTFDRWDHRIHDLWSRLWSSKYRREHPLHLADRAESQIVEVRGDRIVLRAIGEKPQEGDQIILQRVQPESTVQ